MTDLVGGWLDKTDPFERLHRPVLLGVHVQVASELREEGVGQSPALMLVKRNNTLSFYYDTSAIERVAISMFSSDKQYVNVSLLTCHSLKL